ncbi:MAG: CinA family protein [Candidatus Omnitrophica bacterium]|nr:CinA family protein [Candidatus Omnitrophota bacterium]
MQTRKLAQILTSRNLTLATAESCTGGMIANTLTNIPGSSAFLAGGIIAYANRIKTTFLCVPPELIESQGAVSSAVAQAMAAGARKRFKVNYALATTGIAGPTGGTSLKPVGLVFIALATSRKTIVKKCFFTGNRLAIKKQASQTALALLAQTINPGF